MHSHSVIKRVTTLSSMSIYGHSIDKGRGESQLREELDNKNSLEDDILPQVVLKLSSLNNNELVVSLHMMRSAIREAMWGYHCACAMQIVHCLF